MPFRKPRILLGAALLLLIAVLTLFGAAFERSNRADRRDAERRFSDRAQVSAALTESIFSSSAAQTAADNARKYGGDEVDVKALESQVKQGRLAYAVVLDARGSVLAATKGATPEVLQRIQSKPTHVATALAGKTFALSDFIDAPGSGSSGLMEYASPFQSKTGVRVLVNGFPGDLLSKFLGGYLARIPDASRARAYILDSEARVVGSPEKSQPPGSQVREAGLVQALQRPARFGRFDSDGTERAYVEAAVESSPWRVVLSTRTDVLYSGSSPLVQWLILSALGIAGMLAVFLLARTARAAVLVQDANARLEVSNAELARSNSELQRSNEDLEQFASVASHDLQEPLRKVQAFGDQLERRFGEHIPAEGLDYLHRMRRSASRMSTLIEDLMRFSRVTTQAKPPVSVDVAQVARDVTSDLDAPLREAHGMVEIGPLEAVAADPVQMRQLLQNLIANAIKFHRPGIAPEVSVQPAPAPGPGLAAFTVSDNGIGFDPEYAERIFGVFERLHPRDVYEGTGIGLALCRKIVERHHGSIQADGVPGEGARFTVVLPAAPAGQGSYHGSARSQREVANV